LVLFSGVFLFLLKFFFSKNYLAIISTSILEFAILVGCYMVLSVFVKISRNKSGFAGLFYVIFYAFTAFNVFIFSINSVLFDDSLAMKYSFVNFSIGNVIFLFENIVPFKYIILFPVIAIAIGAVSFVSLGRFVMVERYFKFIFCLLLVAGLFIFIFNFGFLSNVYASTLHELLAQETGEDVAISGSDLVNVSYEKELFDKSVVNYSDFYIPKGRKVILFVMEQTSYDSFIEEIGKIPADRNFFEKVKNNSNIFTNYYTTNQDSMTAIWTMFDSQYIPFECYSSDWAKEYGYLLEENNLIDLFNSGGYETHVVSSVFLPGMIQSAHNWTNATFLKKGRNERGFYCLHEYEYEPGCEDRIILEDTENIVKDNKNGGLFLFQEFIYGHGEAYSERLNKTNTEYANDYLFDFYDYLEKDGLLENTTIIFIADHGEKGYYDKEVWNYKIPFIVISKDLEYKEVKGLYSHMDFKDILLSYLEGRSLPVSQDYVFFVGQTKSSEIGYVDKGGNYFLAKLRGDNNFRIRKFSGLSISQIEELLKVFIRYRLDSIERSNKKVYWCQFCEQTARRAGL